MLMCIVNLQTAQRQRFPYMTGPQKYFFSFGYLAKLRIHKTNYGKLCYTRFRTVLIHQLSGSPHWSVMLHYCQADEKILTC